MQELLSLLSCQRYWIFFSPFYCLLNFHLISPYHTEGFSYSSETNTLHLPYLQCLCFWIKFQSPVQKLYNLSRIECPENAIELGENKLKVITLNQDNFKKDIHTHYTGNWELKQNPHWWNGISRSCCARIGPENKTMQKSLQYCSKC